jgi:hypothetical protein
MIIITSLAKAMLGWGVGPKLAKPLAWGIVIAVLVMILSVGKCAYDSSVIEKHDLKTDVIREREDRKADQAAAEQRLEDHQRREQEADQLMKVQEHAAQDPNVDDAYERRLAYHRCLRLQQHARQNGLEPPTCV